LNGGGLSGTNAAAGAVDGKNLTTDEGDARRWFRAVAGPVPNLFEWIRTGIALWTSSQHILKRSYVYPYKGFQHARHLSNPPVTISWSQDTDLAPRSFLVRVV
jgi:hypothetical protein